MYHAKLNYYHNLYIATHPIVWFVIHIYKDAWGSQSLTLAYTLNTPFLRIRKMEFLRESQSERKSTKENCSTMDLVKKEENLCHTNHFFFINSLPATCFSLYNKSSEKRRNGTHVNNRQPSQL